MNAREYEALEDEYLTHEARTLYVMSLRKHMDYETGLVGTAKRRIDFQHFFELLSVSRPRGSTIKPFRPTKQNVRGYIKELIRVGLIEPMPKQHRRDYMVFRCLLATTDHQHPDLFRSNEEQQRSNKRQQPLEQHNEQQSEQQSEQQNKTQLHQGVKGYEQPKEQPLEQPEEQHSEQHRSNLEEQHTSVTSDLNNSLSLSREANSDDLDDFDQRFANQSDTAQIIPLKAGSGRQFVMSYDWRPDDSLSAQATSLGVNLQALMSQDGDWLEQVLEEFRTYWIEQRPHDTGTQRYWQQRFINSLKRTINKNTGDNRHEGRRHTYPTSDQGHRIALSDAIFDAPGCESLSQSDKADVFGE